MIWNDIYHIYRMGLTAREHGARGSLHDSGGGLWGAILQHIVQEGVLPVKRL